MDKKCLVEGCNNKSCSKGYCSKHYAQIRKYGRITDKERNKYKTCKVNDCNDTVFSKGYCKKHYYQKRYSGKVNAKKYNKIIYCDDYAELILIDKNNKEVGKMIIDMDDVELFKNKKVYLHKTGYASCRFNKQTTFVHRIVMNIVDSNLTCDHINGDKLDNRKCNLRICTQADNSKNKKIPKNNTSGHKGVCWNKSAKKWIAYIGKNKKLYNLGSFEYIEDAIKARKEAEEKYFGEFNRDEEYL